MKSSKSLGAAFAVTALLALGIGVGSASATTLCKTGGFPESACGAGKGEHLGLTEERSFNVVLTNSITNVTCTDSFMRVFYNSSTGTPISGEVISFYLPWVGTCKTASGTACEMTVLNLPYPASQEGSTLTISDATGAGFTVKCGFLINCTFTSKELKLSVTNGSPTTMTASKAALTRSGGFCPATAELDATYSVEYPSGFTVK
jgi:hypothetical protein